MFHNFDDVERHILDRGTRRRLVLCGAHDLPSLTAVVDAKHKGVIDGTLIGDATTITELLVGLGEPVDDYEIIDEPREMRATRTAVKLISEGDADALMKGLMQSSEFLLPMMDPFSGMLPEGSILNEVTIFHYPGRNSLIFATDCALNVSPTVEDKVKMVQNSAALARRFGFDQVRVAAVSVLENVTPTIPSTVEAGQLAGMAWESGVVVEGPLALDNALDEQAARHKGIGGVVAGNADVLLLPEICSGNILHKSIHFLAHLPSASLLCGATAPVVFNSRSDSPEMKYNSILAAIVQSL